MYADTFSEEWAILMADEKDTDEQGVKIRAYFNLNPHTSRRIMTFTKVIFYTLLVGGSLSNHLGIEITRKAVDFNAENVMVLKKDVEVCKETQKENLVLRQSVNELIDTIEQLLPSIKSPSLRKRLQEKNVQIRDRIKPVGQHFDFRANELLPAYATHSAPFAKEKEPN